MNTDLVMLNGLLSVYKISQQMFADTLGVSRPYASLLLKGKRDFTVPQVIKTCDLLNLDGEGRNQLFFTRSVDE